jgi:hypothetical protein
MVGATDFVALTTDDTDADADTEEKRRGEPAVAMANAAASASATRDTIPLAIRLPTDLRGGREDADDRRADCLTEAPTARRILRDARRDFMVERSRMSRRRTGEEPGGSGSEGSLFNTAAPSSTRSALASTRD